MLGDVKKTVVSWAPGSVKSLILSSRLTNITNIGLFKQWTKFRETVKGAPHQGYQILNQGEIKLTTDLSRIFNNQERLNITREGKLSQDLSGLLLVIVYCY